MAYLTVGEARRASQSTYGATSAARQAIRKSAATSTETWFDVFLSHSFNDAEIVAGVARLIEANGQTVYVDWRDDPQLDRSQVNAESANLLRQRMAHCRFLIYATSPNATQSRWMPWELGYFDGRRGAKIGILPLLATSTQTWVGQEYLGLYPLYEWINFRGVGTRLGKYTTRTKDTGETLSASVRG
jgi:hypothetical protein